VYDKLIEKISTANIRIYTIWKSIDLELF